MCSICKCHIFTIRSSTDSHLCGFHVFTIRNNATKNMDVKISLQDPASVLLDLYRGVGFLDYMEILCLIF